MAELRPYPFGGLVTRMFREMDASQSIFDLPLRKGFFGDAGRDLSVRFHGRRASTPLGPAAGPQSQMAQNIVLSWLGGSRIMELKTVQVNDELDIPRPCIDMQTVGYNVEWSQELKLAQSLEEYVKGSMLVEILAASGKLPMALEDDSTLFDMSVGYDLDGIRTDGVQAFIDGMRDCSDLVDRLRREIPAEFAELRGLDFPTDLSNTVTLSTFHGCPPGEIEQIMAFLLEEKGLDCIVKLNPMLLGKKRVRELLLDQMGYEEIHVPDSAFERDTTWPQAVDFIGRLGELAERLGRGFGVKFTNTLIVRNHRDFFPPGEKEMYLSGPPLHVLAMNLVARFRRAFGDRYPISFSAGIDRKNFADAAALGLVPITVCSDLLKPGGYGRSRGYFDVLALRMDEVGAENLADYAIRAYGLGGAALDRLDLPPGEPLRQACERALADHSDLHVAAGDELHARWVSEAVLLNTEEYVTAASRDPRYTSAKNTRVPRKIGSRLVLFDCITCDKCIPVCPNDANFRFVLPALETPIVKSRKRGEQWETWQDGTLVIEQKHQIANLADFCNDCGNCDVFCPEDGGPYKVKPRFFVRLEDWQRFSDLDGFCLDSTPAGQRIHGRFDRKEYRLEKESGRLLYAGPDFSVRFEEANPDSIEGEAAGTVDHTYCQIMIWVLDAVYGAGEVNYLNALR